MANIIKPPTKITPESIALRPSIALFGSIEQGTAAHWQARCEEWLKNFDIDIYNPRRDHWDASWNQTIENPQFKGQVEWELTTLENVNARLFYFDPATKSPITLAELGLSTGIGTVDTVVCCPEGYWRKGNVDIICERYGFHQEKTLEDAVANLISKLQFNYGVQRPAAVVIPVPTAPIEEEVVVEDPFE